MYPHNSHVSHKNMKVVHSNKSLRLLPLNLISFGSFGTKINKSKSLCFTTHSNHDLQTQEVIKILKTKQNKTTNTISRVAMQIRKNYGQYEDTK